jgi:hypothetical protein
VFVGVDKISLQCAFVQSTDLFTWTDEGAIFTGTYEEMLAAYTADPMNVVISAPSFHWADVINSVASNHALQVSVDDKTQKGYLHLHNKRVGEIDIITGDFSLDLSSLKGYYMGGDNIAMEQYFYRLEYNSKIPTLQTKHLPISLADPDSGKLNEGANSFVAYMDIDGDGFTAGVDPVGFVKNVEVGWDKVPELTIEMTDSSAAGKRFAYDDSVESLRVIRVGFNGKEVLENGAKIKRRIVYNRDASTVARKCVYDGDLVTAGKFGLDWMGLRSDILAADLALKDVIDVNYIVVKNTNSVDNINEENIVESFTVQFPAEQTKPTLVSPSPSSMPIVEIARPTFKWKGTADNTAFMFRINDAAGNVVYANDMQALPARDVSGNYVWQAPVYISTNNCGDAWALNNNTNYTWQVAMFNAKYSSTEDAL